VLNRGPSRLIENGWEFLKVKKGEFALIADLEIELASTLRSGMIGIGDDAAVLPRSDGSSLLLATDSMVEGRHFLASHLSSYELGWKLLAVTLSDIAAMGGTPEVALISLHLPEDIAFDILEVYRGIRSCAERYGVAVVGGDTVRSTEFSLVSSVLGSMRERPLLRRGAAIGDQLWVSGTLGCAALGLVTLQAPERVSCFEDSQREICRSALAQPIPQISLGRTLATSGSVTSAIDISDGLLQDAAHLATASGVRICIEEARLPLFLQNHEALRAAVCGGEDYQLLWTCAAESKCKHDDAVVSQIGFVAEGPPGISVCTPDGKCLDGVEYGQSLGLSALGFSHW
jgi:thiamine-monophosphate kinase